MRPVQLRTTPARRAVLALLAAGLAVTSCGDPGPDLSPRAAEGRDIARSSGCVSCHGRDGGGGVGPAWTGLVGSPVELEDGSIVTADVAYLRRSIVEPGAEKVAGYTVTMPLVELGDSEVDALVAYIEELR